jgi:2-aminoethylphosphonate-pyruvate transaminase
MGFCIVRKASLFECLGNADSLVLDLHDQWRAMEANDQWRFTPPTHCILALDQALNEFDAEGGVAGRGARYRANCEALVSGMRAMGFETLLSDTLQAPIIVTFHMPEDINFDFSTFYSMMGEKGFVIYPGKLTVADSFRIGCIGRIGLEQVNGALAAVRETLQHMGVRNCGPAKDA